MTLKIGSGSGDSFFNNIFFNGRGGTREHDTKREDEGRRERQAKTTSSKGMFYSEEGSRSRERQREK